MSDTSQSDGCEKNLIQTHDASEPVQTTTLSKSDSDPSTDGGLPKNIKAFRTITMLLNQLQPKIEKEARPEMTGPERKLANISDAFAQLAVTEHDVIAVATRFLVSGVEVVASTNWDMFLTKNFRHNDVEDNQNDNKLPTLMCPLPPNTVAMDDVKKYLAGLREAWCVLCSKLITVTYPM